MNTGMGQEQSPVVSQPIIYKSLNVLSIYSLNMCRKAGPRTEPPTQSHFEGNEGVWNGQWYQTQLLDQEEPRQCVHLWPDKCTLFFMDNRTLQSPFYKAH